MQAQKHEKKRKGGKRKKMCKDLERYVCKKMSLFTVQTRNFKEALSFIFNLERNEKYRPNIGEVKPVNGSYYFYPEDGERIGISHRRIRVYGPRLILLESKSSNRH